MLRASLSRRIVLLPVSALVVTLLLLMSSGVSRHDQVQHTRLHEDPSARSWPLSGWAIALGSDVDASSGLPKRIRRTVDGGEMALIPAGTFRMGVVPADPSRVKNEQPSHAVTLSDAYYMDVAEVTLRMWRRFAKTAEVQ